MSYTRFFLNFLLLYALFHCTACSSDEDLDDGSISHQPNILLIIADDLGKDAFNGYSEGSIKPQTPYLDSLRSSGIAFDNLWVHPLCSPTRAAMLTGKYGLRNGVLSIEGELDLNEIILHKYIKEKTGNAYATALVGKWHVSGNNPSIDPIVFGMDYYAGLLRGGVQSYENWQLTENGMSSLNTDYITKVFSDLAINWISEQDKPWFLWLAYNAPHTPFHVPPSAMHNQGSLPDYMDGMDPLPYYMAAIEAMDFQIGRVLSSIPSDEKENTLILFLGDNGTPGLAAQSPFDRNTAKGSLYQGGINVPMLACGHGINRIGRSDALITATDLFSTISEAAGITTPSIHDSKSFIETFEGGNSSRSFQYSELKDTSLDAWTISNGRYKLLVYANGDEEMYDLLNDPYEGEDILKSGLSPEEEEARSELVEELGKIRD